MPQQGLADSLGYLSSLGLLLVQAVMHLLAGVLPLLAQACKPPRLGRINDI